MEDLSRFGINSQQVLRTLRMEPRVRADLVKKVSDIAKSKNFISGAYSSKGMTYSFISPADIEFDPHLRFGNNQVCKYDEKKILQYLHQFGLYRQSDKFKGGTPISIGIVNALGQVNLSDFLSKLEQELQSLRFKIVFTGIESIQNNSRADLERAIQSLQEKNPHIVLAFFPDEDGGEEEEEWGVYHHFKSLVVGQGMASQVIYQSTLGKQYAIANIVLGILGKTGNIPFILARPVEYADLVVGIDIARQRKERLPGSINATAIARIYFSDGQFLRYIIHDTPLEGESIPERVIQTLFPLREFKDKRVVIHRDGYFRGDEKQALKNWAQTIGATFFLVEVIKTGTPRLYALVDKETQQPPKGSAFKLSNTEAFLVSSLPPFSNATPQPLRIRTESPFTIEQAIHSILSLTLLHYGSLRPPRLPVTIHYSDRIAYLALRGIKPKNLEGNIPFWL